MIPPTHQVSVKNQVVSFDSVDEIQSWLRVLEISRFPRI